ncbi:MAG: hypothetical protein F4X82_01275 [Candidatus Spechtbacteria bacterium SB0662_bin_43]|uniref:Uncharacterized protein n=1 Tax=Candidatus Spechtbacteria bacterium SB0662_bin_43 TaxID=2604897 RepID=A0A845DIW6_9BACT|nr:hypothetical protein [Candidatus Spechtbacteria bacterium SB0662_bin_43]
MSEEREYEALVEFSNLNSPCLHCGYVRFVWLGGKLFACILCHKFHQTEDTFSLNLKTKGVSSPPQAPIPHPRLPPFKN